MKTHIEKAGSNLALLIPKSLECEAQLAENAVFELALEYGKLIATPSGSDEMSLGKMLNQINEHNLHGEIDFGPPVGKEIW